MDFWGQVWKRVWEMVFFGLKLGLDLEMRAAHPDQKSAKEYPWSTQGVPVANDWLWPLNHSNIRRIPWGVGAFGDAESGLFDRKA